MFAFCIFVFALGIIVDGKRLNKKLLPTVALAFINFFLFMAIEPLRNVSYIFINRLRFFIKLKLNAIAQPNETFIFDRDRFKYFFRNHSATRRPVSMDRYSRYG